jgi:hypothetical protein
MSRLLSGTGLGLIAMALLTGGCSSKSPALFVDLDRIEAQSPPIPPSAFVTQGLMGMAGQASELPGLPAQITLSDDSKALSQEAWSEVQASRERLFQDLKTKLGRSYLAEVQSLRDEKREELEKKHEARLEKAWNEIRIKFEKLSAQTGPLVHRLSWLSGFPDPDPGSRRKSTSDKLRQGELDEAAALRKQISALEAQYRLEVKSLLKGLEADKDSTLISLIEQEKREDANLLRQAEAEAKRRAAQALSAISESAFSPEGSLPAQPPVKVQGPDVRAKSPTDWSSSPRSPWPLRDRLKDEAMIYIRLKGGKVASTPKGAQDVTKEFLAWRRSRN